jgi:predicted negative regulator of RcsB-dependent stress response
MATDNNGNGNLLVGLGLMAVAGVGGVLGYKYITSKNTSTTTTTTSTYTPQLTTINWSVSPTSLPNTGGNLTFQITALDQYNNPYSGATLTLLESENSSTQIVGTFPSTNSAGQSQLNVNIPANSGTSSITMTFTLGGV